jgi:hypothetical protein
VINAVVRINTNGVTRAIEIDAEEVTALISRITHDFATDGGTWLQDANTTMWIPREALIRVTVGE